MTWIRTVPLAEASERLLQALATKQAFYPMCRQASTAFTTWPCTSVRR
jgi:hypothetical protein